MSILKNKKQVKLSKKLKEKIVSIPRKKYHPILHYIRKKHKLSRKTMFYMKEYGPRANIISVIIKESILILLLTSILSSLGGIGLEFVQKKLLSLLPLLILLPALNDMIGDFGTIISSKFTTALFEGKISGSWWKSKYVHQLAATIFSVSFISGAYISVASYFIALLQGFAFSFETLGKVVSVTLISVLFIISLIFLISIFIGFKVYKKGYDPNNFLIPLTTGIADIFSMIFLSLLILLFF